MIKLQMTKYRLIGIRPEDASSTEENSVIDIWKQASHHGGPYQYSYRVISGKVFNNVPNGQGSYFSQNSRLHAYCVPVGMGTKTPLPDLKEGDWVINTSPGCKAFKMTYDTQRYLMNNGGMLGMRYACMEEQRDGESNSTCPFKEGDKVTSTDHWSDQIKKDTIWRVRQVKNGYLYLFDTQDEFNNYSPVKFRAATPLEIDAYNHGYRTGTEWKHWLEREATKRFPSPASYTDIYGKNYQGICWDVPCWDGDRMMLCRGYGYIYSCGQWATPIDRSYNQSSKRYYPYPDDSGSMGYGKLGNLKIDPKSALGLQSLEEEVEKIKHLFGNKVIEEKELTPHDYMMMLKGTWTGIRDPDKLLKLKPDLYKQHVMGDLPVFDLKDLRPKKGKGFDEYEYRANPMNQKLELSRPRTWPIYQSLHNRIKF